MNKMKSKFYGMWEMGKCMRIEEAEKECPRAGQGGQEASLRRGHLSEGLKEAQFFPGGSLRRGWSSQGPEAGMPMSDD